MKNVIVVYRSRRGQTKKIAQRLAETLGERGISAVALSLEEASQKVLETSDAVIMGTPVYIGRTDKKIEQWAAANHDTLSKKETGLFLVCLNAADKRPEARNAEQAILKNFIDKTHLHPRISDVFAGSLNYKEYNFLVKALMKRISRAAGGPTDTSKDYELTDWKKVDQFAEAFSQPG